MQILRRVFKRTSFASIALGYMLLLAGGIVWHSSNARAAQLTNRSMTVSSSAVGTVTTGAPGSGSNGQKAKYTFTFTPSTASIGSLSIMFCTAPIPTSGSCTTPTGFDASHVASIQSSNLAGSVSLDTTTTNPS